MKIEQLFESKLIFGGLLHEYETFEVNGSQYNVIWFGLSNNLTVQLSNKSSTVTSTEEVLEPVLKCDDAETLKQVIKKGLVIVEVAMPNELQVKDESVVVHLLIKLDKADDTQAGYVDTLDGYSFDNVNIVNVGTTKYTGITYQKFEVSYQY